MNHSKTDPWTQADRIEALREGIENAIGLIEHVDPQAGVVELKARLRNDDDAGALSAPPEGELRCRICGMVGTYQAAPEIDFKQRGGMNPASPAPPAPPVRYSVEYDVHGDPWLRRGTPTVEGDYVWDTLGPVEVAAPVSSPPPDSAALQKLEAAIRQQHYYGHPPDSRLQADVDSDVEEIVDLARTAFGSPPRAPEGLRDRRVIAQPLSGSSWGEWEVLYNDVRLHLSASEQIARSFAEDLERALASEPAPPEGT